MFSFACTNARGSFLSWRGLQLSTWHQLKCILLLALAARVAVRWHSGAPDFWENGYTFFFLLAEHTAAGNRVAFDGSPPTAFRIPLAFRSNCIGLRYPMVECLRLAL